MVQSLKRLSAGRRGGGSLLAASLHDFLAGAQALGLQPSGLSRPKSPASLRKHRAFVASASAHGGFRRVVRRGGVRRASPARGVCRVDNFEKGPAFGPVLSRCLLYVDTLYRGASLQAVRGGARAVRGRAVLQVDRGHLAGCASHFSVVEKRPRHSRGPGAGGAVFSAWPRGHGI